MAKVKIVLYHQIDVIFEFEITAKSGFLGEEGEKAIKRIYELLLMAVITR